jgi:iron complex transport system ATP-binding protein
LAEPRLRTKAVTFGYDEREVVSDLSVAIPDARMTAVVGANACGKSTLLKGLARLLAAKGGTVLLDGEDIHRAPTREVARRVGMLPQSPVAPDGIKVVDLVARGRYAHHKWYEQWTQDNEEAVTRALLATRTMDLAARPVDELSGGQRQRVWIAMAIAQNTPILLLDEPTTYLDLAHQIEVLELLRALNRSDGRTIVLVLHDLNHAARYADHLVAMVAGAVVAEGPPESVVTERFVHDVFGLRARVIEDPVSGAPLVLPLGHDHTPTSHEGRA